MLLKILQSFWNLSCHVQPTELFFLLLFPLWFQKWGGAMWTPWWIQTSPWLFACRILEECQRPRWVETPRCILSCSRTCGSILDRSLWRNTCGKCTLWPSQRWGGMHMLVLHKCHKFKPIKLLTHTLQSISTNWPSHHFILSFFQSRFSLMSPTPSIHWCRKSESWNSPSRSQKTGIYIWQRSWTERTRTWYMAHAWLAQWISHSHSEATTHI